MLLVNKGETQFKMYFQIFSNVFNNFEGNVVILIFDMIFILGPHRSVIKIIITMPPMLLSMTTYTTNAVP